MGAKVDLEEVGVYCNLWCRIVILLDLVPIENETVWTCITGQRFMQNSSLWKRRCLTIYK